ncbi:hypothetical protein FRC17_003147 [Serendipita sp. 399]|nr:hypothetical protein FRC17_003147 [Serendipita sp. 399]
MNINMLQGIGRNEGYLKSLVTSNANRPNESNPEYEIAYGLKLDVCEEGTRTEILTTIREWANNKETGKQIFWLSDAAGTGKSTLAATLAKEWRRGQSLAGCFFFSPNNVNTKSTDAFCTIVARNIAANQQVIGNMVWKAIQDYPPDHYSFEEQLEQLIIQPLSHLRPTQTIYLVIDALDNCEVKEQREQLLKLLIRFIPSVKFLKLLLTSRPLLDISDHLAKCPLVDGTSIQLFDPQQPAHDDIAIYVKTTLGTISTISEENKSSIVEQSNGLFLYAATVCRMLKSEKRRQVAPLLKILMSKQLPHSVEQKMDGLYLSVLKEACVDDIDKLLMDVLSLIIAAFQPISINTISAYLPKNDQVADIVQELGAVLKGGDPDRPIQVLHPTFREFLSDQKRASEFFVDAISSHEKMAYGCMDTLERSLHCNILQLEFDMPNLLPPNSTVSNIEQLLIKYTTPATQYASLFWARHVEAANISLALWSRTLTFLRETLLSWIEYMSWKENVASSVDSLSRIHALARRFCVDHPGVLSREDMLTTQHAHQFIVSNQTLISESALHAYSVALFMTPSKSSLFSQYREIYRAQWAPILTPQITDWGRCLELVHSLPIYTLPRFSQDGSRLVVLGALGGDCCGSDKGGFEREELLLWDTMTGACIKKLSEAPDISPCIFSPDGQYIGFVAHDSLCVHVLETGQPVIPPIKLAVDKTTGNDYQCSFSTTGAFITIVTHENLAHRYSLMTGDKVSSSDISQGGTVEFMFFSSSGQRMATIVEIKDEKQIVIWNLDTFSPTLTSEIHEDASDGRFSADDTRLVTWHAPLRCEVTDKPMQLWYISDEKQCQEAAEIRECPGIPDRLDFSPSLTYVAIMRVCNIEIWNGEDGQLISILEHSGYILSLSFSNNEDTIASASDNDGGSKVYIWDISAGRAHRSIDISTGHLSDVCLSPDWTHVATQPSQCTITLYNLQHENNGVDQDAESIANLFDSSLSRSLVSSFDQATQCTRLWDIATGKEVEPQVTLSQYRFFTSISPDSQMMASPGNHAVIITSMTTGKESELFSDLITYYNKLLFSPDSKRLAAIDSKTHIFRSTPKVMRLNTADISPKKDLIATVTYRAEDSRHVLELWRVGTELDLVDIVVVGEMGLSPVTFSHDGRYIACGAYCWDITSIPAELYTGKCPPDSFYDETGAPLHPFMFYKNGWIHSSYPPRPLLPLPAELWSGLVKFTSSNHGIVVHKKGPVIIDFSPMLSRIREL